MKLFPNWALLKTMKCSPRISYAGKTRSTEDKHLPEATGAARTLTPGPRVPQSSTVEGSQAGRALLGRPRQDQRPVRSPGAPSARGCP